jgi:hypothetical protein
MRIDQNNYEAILLDYLDGNLSAAEVVEVLLFLEQNPHIKAELEGLSEISFPDEKTDFDIVSLRKPEFHEVSQIYENLLLGKLEGDLDAAQQQQLQHGFVLYPELHHEETLFAQTKLTADPSEIFTAKRLLKKETMLRLYRQTITRVAAILLLVGGIGFATITFSPPKHKMQAISTPPTSVLPDGSQGSIPAPVYKSKTIPALANADPGILLVIQPRRSLVKSQQQIHYSELELNLNNPIRINTPQLALADLPKSSGWLDHSKPAKPGNNDGFMSLPAFLRQQFTKETKQLEQKTITALQDMNKTAGVNITKDSSGRVTHFEIVALGIEWSQTK